jgi:hypothetical protein
MKPLGFKTAFIVMGLLSYGVPYVYGGQRDDELDCSGLIIQSLRRLPGYAVVPDMTAEGIRVTVCVTAEDQPPEYLEHCPELLFWLEGGQAHHVGISLGELDVEGTLVGPLVLHADGLGTDVCFELAESVSAKRGMVMERRFLDPSLILRYYSPTQKQPG